MSLSKNENPQEFHYWSLLPNEIKMKCIEETGVRTRIALQRSAFAEKELIDTLRLTYHDTILSWHHKKQDFFEKFNNSFAISLQLGCDDWTPEEIPNIQVEKELTIYEKADDEISLKVLEIQKNRELEVIRLDARGQHIDGPRLMKIQAIRLAKCVQIENGAFCRRLPVLFAKMWISTNAEAGRKMEILMMNTFAFPYFQLVFKNRIVEYITEVSCRIRTNNPRKHIFIGIVNSSANYDATIIACHVIPADADDFSVVDRTRRLSFYP